MRKEWIRRLFGNLCVATVLALLFAVPDTPVFAATTQDVVVNATPAYVSISNAPATYGFGTVVVSTNYSSTQNYFTITDSSTVNIDVAVSCNATWLGGNGWTHSDAGTPGSTTAAMSADPNTGAWNILVKNGSPVDLFNDVTGNQNWGIRLAAPTAFDDGVIKTNTVTLTATAH